MSGAPSAVRIRPATESDLDRLPALAARSFRDAYAATDSEEDLADYVTRHFTRARFDAILRDPASRVLVATSVVTNATTNATTNASTNAPTAAKATDATAEAELVGYAHLATNAPPDCVTGPDPVELVRLYLLGSATGRGIGDALLRAALAEARAWGRRTLWLGVYDRNVRAQRFYRRHGLETVGIKPFRFGGKDCLDPVMAGPIVG